MGGERGDAPEALPDQAVDLIVGNLGEDNLEEDLVGDGVLARAGQGSAPNCDSSGGPSSAVAEASSEARARTARRAREKEADARGANRRRVASPSFAEPRTRAATDVTSA